MKRSRLVILGALLLVLLAGAGAFAFTLTPATLPLAPLPALSEPVAHPPPEMKIAALRSGTMESRAAFAFRGGDIHETRQFSMGGILIQHPSGTLLVDTGFGRNVDAHMKSAPLIMQKVTVYAKGTPIADQLATAGVDLHTLRGIVITHAHWDHVSGLDDMRGVPVLVPQKELDFIRSDDIAASLIHSFGDLAYKVYDFPSGPYLGFDQSYDVYQDGSVVIVPAGGHTPGSVIVFVTLPDRKRYAFVGDIVWQKEGVEVPAERPWLTRSLADKDEAQVRTVIVRLHMLKERFPDLVIVPAHDERVWATLPALASSK